MMYLKRMGLEKRPMPAPAPPPGRKQTPEDNSVNPPAFRRIKTLLGLDFFGKVRYNRAVTDNK